MTYQVGDWIPLSECGKLPSVSGIYVIRNTLNGKEYVGQSIDVHRRLVDHVRKPVEGRYLYRAISKYGITCFQVCLLLTVLREELQLAEIAVISERGCQAPAGYNLTSGGEGCAGLAVSEETREKLRQANLGKKASEETRMKQSIALTGRKLSPEHLAASTRAKLGRPRSESMKAKMRVVSTGRIASEETRRKIGLASLGHKLSPEAVEKIRQANIGKRHSEETKAKISAVQLGKKASEETKTRMKVSADRIASRLHKEVMLWEQDCLIPRIFVSAKAASEYLGVNLQYISVKCLDTRDRPLKAIKPGDKRTTLPITTMCYT